VPAGGTFRDDGVVTRFETASEAKKRVAEARRLIRDEAATVENVVTAYLDFQRAKGCKLVSTATSERRLRLLLDVDLLALPAARLAPVHVQRAYDALVGRGLSVAYHRGALVEARSLGKWAAKRGYWLRNPFSEVEGVGVKRCGKRQPTHEAARKMLDAALAMGAEGDERGSYVSLLLVTGLRPSELQHRLVCDVDEVGARLVIPESKTQAGVGAVAVPVVVRPLLLALTEAKLPLARLFTQTGKCWPTRAVHAVCDRGGVPRVCAYALRGLHSSEARRQGTTAETVARSLGHAGPEVTRRHYITGDAERAARQGKVLEMLQLEEISAIPLPAICKSTED
jgi:integrase